MYKTSQFDRTTWLVVDGETGCQVCECGEGHPIPAEQRAEIIAGLLNLFDGLRSPQSHEHTPAPWTWRVADMHAVVTGHRNGEPCLIARDLWDEENEPTLEEVEANARLIAAAPVMLELLRRLLGSNVLCRPRTGSATRYRGIDEQERNWRKWLRARAGQCYGHRTR